MVGQMKLLISVLALLSGIALPAQPTRPLLSQLGIGAAPPSACSIVVFVPKLGYVPATLDPSVICDTSGALPVIRVSVTGAAARPIDVFNEVHLAMAGFQIPLAHSFIAGTQRVHRNGVRMAPGIDYDVGMDATGAGTAVVFRPDAQKLQPGDIILVDYQMPAAAIASALAP